MTAVTDAEVDRPSRRAIAGLIGAAVLVVAVPLAVSRFWPEPPGEVFRYEIPAGTAARLAAGERVEIIPADLQLSLRDRLVVVNHDDLPHQIGPFSVGPGRQLDERFSDAISLSGFCSLHPNGDFRLEVRG